MLYDKRRTFNDYMYDTIEKRDFAEEQYKTLVSQIHEDMDFDEVIEKYEETFAEDVTEKNRQDVQSILIKHVSVLIDDFSETEALEPYITYATEKKVQHNLEDFDLLDVLEKKHKKLARKEKFNAGVSGAKDKLAATTKNLKGFGKDVLQKAPFGKKSESETMDEQHNEMEIDAAPEENMGKNMSFGGKSFMTGAKDRVLGMTEKVKSGISNLSESEPGKNCPQCGNVVKATGKFCGKCGYRF